MCGKGRIATSLPLKKENREDEMFLRYYWTIAIYFQSNTYYFLSSTPFRFPLLVLAGKKGINDERRGFSHQFSGSSSCKEGSILLKLYSHFQSERTWRPYFRLQQEIDERCE